VVKSHGSADATGVSAAIKLAFTLARSGFQDRMAERLASVSDAQQEHLLSQETIQPREGGTEEDNQMGQS
jgi:glycerol-3-phosphate acyltransferase PlsX